MAERALVAFALTLALAPIAQAQNADSLLTMRANEALTRVRRFTTSDVNTARQIADSLVRVLPADATVMPEALFAKASIAPSAADAEKDYSRIVNEYRFAARVPDALMRLALLEGARSNRVGALRHLDRLLRDHSESAVRSRASLMAGRLRLEMNDPARGCELLAAAWASAGLNERDVKDQAEQLGAKCPVSVAERAQRDPSPLGILRAQRESVPTAAILGTAQTAAGRRRQRDSVLAAQAAVAAARRDSVAKAAAAARAVPVARPTPAVSAPRADTAPARVAAPVTPVPAPIVRRDTAPTPRPATPASASDAPASAGRVAAMRYAVQFAAYNDRPGAEQFARTLQQRGIAARVEGSEKPFRVRAGRYASRDEAEAQATLWRKPGQAAIVVSYP